MIIFYNKRTGAVIGTVEGWLHDDAARAMTMLPQGMTPDEVGKYIIEVGSADEGLARELEHPQKPLSLSDVRITKGRLTNRTR